MLKKGFIFTIDSIFALFIALIIIAGTFILYNNSDYNKDNLNQISQDSLTILEKDSTLEKSFANQNNLTKFVNNLPYQVCAKIDLKDTSKNTLVSVLKNDCKPTQEKAVVRRVFISNNNGIYYAEMEAWHKK